MSSHQARTIIILSIILLAEGAWFLAQSSRMPHDDTKAPVFSEEEIRAQALASLTSQATTSTMKGADRQRALDSLTAPDVTKKK